MNKLPSDEPQPVYTFRAWFSTAGLAFGHTLLYNASNQERVHCYFILYETQQGCDKMQKRKVNLNALYFSDQLQAELRGIGRHALTLVVAPMGYGKTTAVNWYLGECAQQPGTHVVRISVYSDSLPIFWQSVQYAFDRAGYDVLRGYGCPQDAATAAMLMDDLNSTLAGPDACYIFIDDFHLLQDRRAAVFILRWAQHLPNNVHIIIASRNRYLQDDELVRLGSRVCLFGPKQLRLDKAGLGAYIRRCGGELSDADVDKLLFATEGWFSAVYLSLQTLEDRGTLPDKNSDIYALFTAAMIDPLPPMQQEFLTVLGLADEFTIEMAEAVTGRADAAALLADLTSRNAFVKRLPDSDHYRFHHMMKDCAARAFRALPQEKQLLYYDRYGQWFERHGLYLRALAAYRAGENFDGCLRVVEKDAGIRLATLPAAAALADLATWPQAALKAHPTALLVLMRCMFNWKQIPRMLQYKALLLTSLEEHPEWDEAQRGNLLGECELIESLLVYNDLSAMSRMYRRAADLMRRPATSIHAADSWTFGSPSVLWMFHRGPGLLDEELVEMGRCMLCYYHITNDRAKGADLVMRGEAALLRGEPDDAQIELERAYAAIEGNGQENIALCCDFLALRLYLLNQGSPRYTPQDRREILREQRNQAWLRLWDAGCAYFYALLGKEERIPEAFRTHQLESMNFLAPGLPIMQLIENQVYLTQQEWAKVIGRSEKLLHDCGQFHYGLVSLYIRIQTTAAYAMLNKRAEAARLLCETLFEAAKDDLALPFAENYRYLAPLLQACPQSSFTRHINALGAKLERRCGDLRCHKALPAFLSGLTGREREICTLIAARLTNREIGLKLYLSEGSVKQYTNQIYSKLHIEGDTRTKRKRLIDLLQTDNS